MATLPGGWPWVASVLFLFFASAVHRRKKYARYPPGPTPLPLVGNILDFPRTHLGREFAAMSKKFGDVVYLNVLGQRFVIIGSLKAARDLLDKRSANYSDRPPSVMVQLVGYEWITVFMNYGPRWREHRRAFHATMAAGIVPQYQGIQLNVARNFLRILLRSPQGLASHVKFTITAVFIGAVYGIELCELQDQYYQTVERVAEVAEALVIPGNFPVEAFPMLRYLPSWLPGGGFKAWAANAKEDILHTVDDLFHGAKDRMMRNPSKRSVISCMLEDSALHGEQVAELEKVCKDAAATLYFAAADTSTATMAAFFVAMVLYPDVQKRAQQELDAVVGTERLPEFSDRPSLPYLNALVKELLRWHPVTPIGAPHRVVADDEYDGHLIPSGASVFVNIWAILHDQKVYPKPDDFVPERFLDSAGNLDVQGRDPADVMFGFGRRVCPGRYLAEATLFILCASVLATFNIGPPVGEDGAPREVALEAMDHWILSRPKIHNYSIKPRQANVELLVEGTSVSQGR